MAATIKIKNSSTAGAAPTSSDLVQGELAVNVTDKRLYTENASGTVVELGTNPSVPVTFPDGSASAPSLTNDGDTNTGLFFPAADTVGIATGGSERARVDSSGNLGLGVTPNSWTGTGVKALQFQNGALAASNSFGTALSFNAYFDTSWKYVATGVTAGLYKIEGNSHNWNVAASGTAGNSITFTQAMTLDASGNLIVGGTSPTTSSGYTSLSINNATNSGYVVLQNNGTNKSDWYVSGGTVATLRGVAVPLSFEATGANYVKFETNGSERARIDSSGNLLVGTTSQIGVEQVGISFADSSKNGLGIQTQGSTSGAGFIAFRNSSGTNIGSVARVGTTNAVVYNTTSDQRLKSNIENAEPILDTLMQVQVRQFDWTEGELHQDYGFIAQELNQILSGVVTEGKTNDDMWQMDYSRLTPHLVKAIQELNAKFEAYKAAHP